MRSVLDGEPEAQRTFAARMRCVPRILAARNARSGRPLRDDELSDLAQDTLLLVWKKLADYSGRAALETWVYRFCSLELFNWIRRKSKEPRSLSDVGEEADVPDGARGDELEGAGEEGIDLLLRHLAPREAEVIRMRHVDQLDVNEVSEHLGISKSSVKTHYYRGLEKLRDVLAARAKERERRDSER